MKKIDKDIEKRYDRAFKKAQKLKANRHYGRALKKLTKIFHHYKSINNERRAMEVLFLMGECYLDNENVEEALPLFHRVLQGVNKIPNDRLEAAVFQRLGIIYGKLADQKKSLRHFFNSYKRYKMLNDIPNQIVGLSSIGLLFKEAQNIVKALKYFHKAEKLCEKNQIYSEIAPIYQNLADLYLELRDLGQFKKYMNLSLQTFENISGEDRLTTFFINLMATMGNISDFEGEEEILLDLLKYSEENNLKGCKITLLLNLGKFYLRKGELDKAEVLTLKALKITNQENISRELCRVNYDLAVIYRNKKDYPNAIEFAQKSLDLSKKTNSLKFSIDNYLILGKIYYDLGRYHQSYRNYSEALNLFRQILDQFSTKELRESYKENFKELPEILANINDIIENQAIEPELLELTNVKQIGIQACKAGERLIEDFNKQKCQDQNDLLERTIVSEFKKTIKEIKLLLPKYSFNVALRDFEEALGIYDSGRKAPLSLIRSVLEGIVKKIVKKLGKKPKGMKKSLEFLEKEQIIKATPQNKQDPHVERSAIYKIYGVLSNYGSHPSPQDSEITPNIFISTIGIIHLILKRFDLVKHKV